MCAKMKKVWEEWWPRLRASWGIRWPTLVVVIVAGVVLWFAAHDENPSEFLIKVIHELAWPTVMLSLLGHYYREPLNDFIARLQSVKGPGVELSMRPEEREGLKRRLSETNDADSQRRIGKLLKLSPEALQLLGNLVAVGLSQNLNFARFKEPQFEQGKGELLFGGLAVREGQYYRPTLEGVWVFSAHVEDLKERLAAPEKKIAT